MYSPARSTISGYTLVEMLITLAVITVLTAMAIPSLSKMVDSVRLNSTASIIKRQLMTAKTRAVTNPIFHCGVYVNGNAYPPYMKTFSDTNSNNVYDAGEKVYDSTALPVFITMKVPGGSAAKKDSAIIFRGDGSAYNTDNRKNKIKLCMRRDTTKAKTISVLAITGRIRLQ